jgi:hypothetical protein
MKLSHLQNPCREGLNFRGYETISRDQLTQIKAPVEPKTKFCQLPGKCFVMRSLKITRNEFFTFTMMVLSHLNLGILTLSGTPHEMIAVWSYPASTNCIETAKIIGDNVRTWSHMNSSPTANSFQGE